MKNGSGYFNSPPWLVADVNGRHGRHRAKMVVVSDILDTVIQSIVFVTLIVVMVPITCGLLQEKLFARKNV